MMSHTRRGAATAALALSLALVGCTTTPEPVPTVAAEDRVPLELSLGTLLPETGSLAKFGAAPEAAAQLAATDITNAGAGITVTITNGDAGDATTNRSVKSTTALLDAGVSVIVGPISDNVSRKVLDTIVGAGVVQISPGNVATDFTRAADDDLYWRTAPSCTLEGDAMGKQIAADGVATLGIVFEKDYCEPGLPEALSAAFERLGGKVVALEGYSAGASNLDKPIAATVAENPGAVVVIGSKGVDAVAPLAKAGYPGSALYFVGLSLKSHGGDVAKGALTGATASQPGLDVSTLDSFTDRLLDVNPALKDFSYAAETYDAVVLAALAALAANSTTGADIAATLQEVSGGTGAGEKATDFASAADIILAGGVVDYDGVSGGIAFDAKGDPQEAAIGLYRYGADDAFDRIN